MEYTFIVIENENKFGKFFGKNRFGVIKELYKDGYYYKEKTVNSFLNNIGNYKDKALVVLWHLSASGISDEQIEQTIKELKSPCLTYVLKIGRSESEIFLNNAKKTGWFHILDYGQKVQDLCKIYKWDIDIIIKESSRFKIQQNVDVIKPELLHLFLPLDIDMCALEMLWDKVKQDNKNNIEKKEYVEKTVCYFREMLNNAKNGFYGKKCDEWRSKANDLIANLSDQATGDNLKNLLGVNDANNFDIYNFLSFLDKKEGKKLEKKDIEAVINFFKGCGKDNCWKNLNSFHQWYHSVGACLKDDGASKKKMF